MASKLWVLIDVKGVNFDNREKYIRKHVSEGSRVKLVREPENPFDRDAVLVQHKRRDLGYVPRELAGMITSGLRRNRIRQKAKIVLVEKGDNPFVFVLTSISPNPLKFLSIRSIYA